MPTMTGNLETGVFMPVGAGTGEPLQLAMQQLSLTGRILPVGAHLLVVHRFRSAEKKMLEVVYAFGLPRDAALRRFEIQGVDFAVRSALKPVRQAMEEYEKGVADGHLSALARQYRDGLVNLSVGNLRPGEEVTVILEILAGVELRDDGFRFRFPFTLAPSYHAQARIAEVDPGQGEIELPAGAFGDLLLPAFRKSADGLHQVSFDLALEMPWEVAEIASPSHSLRVSQTSRVSLAPASDLPDRDLVLDVKFQQPAAGVLAGAGEEGRRHFAAILPSGEFGAVGEVSRKIVLLIDRSGSMSGAPISQARKAAAACLATLGPEDGFGLLAFDDRCERFKASLVDASPQNRSAALAFLNQIDARGGTELAAGIREAAALLRGSGGDIFILTDGQVFATEEILALARSTGCRLHSLGIGSASQDRFLALLSRETSGISRFVTPRERVDSAALELFAQVARPVATAIRLASIELPGGTVSPDPVSTAFAGTPLLLFGDCDPQATGTLVVEFNGAKGPESRRIALGAENHAGGETLRLLRGSRLITDAESHLGGETDRESQRWNEYLTRLSEQYSLASRSMALVAVVERAADTPGAPPKTHIVPVGMPQDMQFEGVFAGPPTLAAAAMPCMPMMVRAAGVDYAYQAEMCRESSIEEAFDESSCNAGLADTYAEATYESAPVPPAVVESPAFDRLMDLAIRLESDGGMPGKKTKERILTTLLTLLAFLAEGHDLHSGPFRLHIKRMMDYLDTALPAMLFQPEYETVQRAVKAIRSGRVVAGNWLEWATDAADPNHGPVDPLWKELETAFA